MNAFHWRSSQLLALESLLKHRAGQICSAVFALYLSKWFKGIKYVPCKHSLMGSAFVKTKWFFFFSPFKGSKTGHTKSENSEELLPEHVEGNHICF